MPRRLRKLKSLDLRFGRSERGWDFSNLEAKRNFIRSAFSRNRSSEQTNCASEWRKPTQTSNVPSRKGDDNGNRGSRKRMGSGDIRQPRAQPFGSVTSFLYRRLESHPPFAKELPL